MFRPSWSSHALLDCTTSAAGPALRSCPEGVASTVGLLTIAYGATFVHGLAVAVAGPNALALNQGDNWLHATRARSARDRALASPGSAGQPIASRRGHDRFQTGASDHPVRVT
jgi:hypothetical protein